MSKIAYILGHAHSVSTLLDVLLGSHASAVSTGELWAFPIWVKENRPCSCGKPVRECSFWGQVLALLQKEFYVNADELHPPDELRPPGRLWKIKAAWSKRPDIPREKALSYCKQEEMLFQAIQEVSGASLIVDSSKMLHRLIKLRTSNVLDIKVIHLVRDGRAALDSARRAAKRRAVRGEMVLRRHTNPLWIYSGWITTMRGQLNFLRMLNPSEYRRVTYETLARDPERIVQELCVFLGIEFDPTVLDPTSPRYVFKQPHHIIGGSRLLRMVKRVPETPIEYKDDWERNLGLLDRALFGILGGTVLNRRLGVISHYRRGKE